MNKLFDLRLFHFMRKEILQMLRDRRLVYIVILAPVIQLIAFGYIASTDIKHIATAVLDEDKSSYSRTYLRSFANAGYFDLKYYARSQDELRYLIDSGRAKLGLHIPVEFGKKIIRGETSAAQAVIDGSNSSTASIVLGYISQINFGDAQTILQARLARAGVPVREVSLLDVNTRVWYNPELKSENYMIPGIFATLLMNISMILTSASIVKEKERGTMEMLAATPLKPFELILGKLLPFGLVAMFDIVLVSLIATLWFGIPIKGSVIELFLLGTIFLLTGLGLGVFFSTVSQNQRQAMMSSVFIQMPQMMLSGFIFPIANMPLVIQWITYLIPIRYFLEIVRDIFLKGTGIINMWNNIWPMILFSALILWFSVAGFRKKIG